ncbi:flagellar biosynthesis anti-sigma factor FlgM [Bacillota bacterium Lsc_1132]
MKINPFGSHGINPYKRQMNKMDQSGKMVPKQVDRVEISSTAKEMQQISQLPAERQAKVEELKNQVEKGIYKIDPQKVAKSIVDFYTNQ